MNGIYGTTRPADIDVTTDVEIFYRYRPTRSTSDSEYVDFKVLDTSCLVPASTDGSGSILGLYDLKLPLDKFNLKGYYTIFIRPKEEDIDIYDAGVLSTDSNVRGVVFQGVSKDLTGYRLEYKNSDGERTDTVRLITSCNACEPMPAAQNMAMSKSNAYRLLSSTTDGNGLVFCTVTPSTAPSYRSNYSPYIGAAGDKAVLINTKFNPIMLEIEMVEYDNETISYMLEGDQARDRDNSIITTYNDEHEIYHQFDYYTTKDNLGKPLHDIKQKREDIDGSQLYGNVITPGETE